MRPSSRVAQKRGQLSLFMVIAAVLVIVGGMTIYLFTSGTTETEVEEDVPFDPQSINRYLESCLRQESVPLIQRIAKQGGMLNTSGHDSLMYYNKTYYHRCLYEGGKGCVNELITRSSMEAELDTYIEREVKECINLTPYEKDKGYDVSTQEPDISTRIGVNDIYISLHYPIRMERGDFSIRSDDVSVTIKSNLGYLYDLSVQILNGEITDHFFNIDKWMRYNGDTKIYRHRPYPDVTYELSRHDQRTKRELHFRFAVDGTDTVEYVGKPEELPEENLHGYCMTPDENCHANVKPTDCHQILDGSPIGTYNMTAGTCTGLSDIMGRAGKEIPRNARYETECGPGENCRDCTNNMEHGDARCLYDGPAGEGADYVGSRHNVMKCFDGEIIIEECRDYREQLCAEVPSEDKAVCRVNRWHDCSDQETKSECLNQNKRDCDWNPDLFDSSTPTYGIKSDKTPCHPEVPPGFRHWKMPYNRVCAMANEHRKCDGFQCPTLMNERQNLNCVYQGDCGMWRNIADKKTSEGLHLLNPNNRTREGIAYPPQGLLNHQQGAINVTLLNRSQPPISNDVYDNPTGTLQKILKHLNAFIQEASSWDLCTFCDHGWYCGPPCTYDKLTQFATVCSAWQPPDGGTDCSECNNDWRKPCTEYRCKSLGKTCEFTKEKGIGYCEDGSEDDDTGPTISMINATYPPGNYTVEEPGDTLWEGNLFGLDAYYICHGDGPSPCTDDKAGTDGLEPYTPLTVRLNLSEEARCKTFPIDFFEFEEIPDIIPTKESYTYNDTYTYETTVTSMDSIFKRIAIVTGYQSILNVILLNEVDSLVSDTYTDMKSLLNDFDQDTSDLDGFYNYYMNNISTPLHNYINSYQDSINTFTTNMEARKVSAFVRCVDKAGNNEVNDFMVQYTIGRDTRPPNLELVSPPNTSAVSTPFDIAAWFNEPAECKYDYSNISFAAMEHSLDCPTGFMTLQQKGYKCTGTINTTTFPIDLYIRCLDQPKIEKEYYIKLQNSTITAPAIPLPSPSSIDVNKTFNPDLIHVKDPHALRTNTTPRYYFNESATLRIDFDMPKECRFSVDDHNKSYSEMPYAMSCTGNNCTYDFDPPPTDYGEYKISCVMPSTNPRNEGSYRLHYPLH